MKFVLDASVTLAWFMPDESPERHTYAHDVLFGVQAQISFAVVPLLWHEEVAHVLLRARRSRELSTEQFERAIALLSELPVETHLNGYAVPILVQRALRYHLQGFDTVYFELAYVLELPIAALDGGLRTAARAHGVKLFDPA